MPSSSSKKFHFYVTLPLSLSLAMLAAVYSGVPWLQHIVAPEIDGLSFNSQREFGLLENLQNLVLAALVVVALIGLRRKEMKIEKLAFLGLALVSAWFLLEEMDYGWHFRELLWGQRPKTFRNVHNIGEVTGFIEQSGYVIMGLLFVVWPLVRRRFSHPWLRYLCPDSYSMLTIGVMLVTRLVIILLTDVLDLIPGTLANNTSEFGELLYYYIFLLYFHELVFHRSLPALITSARNHGLPAASPLPRV